MQKWRAGPGRCRSCLLSLRGAVLSEQYVLGIDAGTSSAKVGLVTREGILARMATEAYPMSSPHPGWSEQNAKDWWRAIKVAIGKVMSGIEPTSVVGIGLSNAGGSLVLLDEQGQPVRPAIVWMDGRALQEGEQLMREKGRGFWVRHLGHDNISHGLACRLVWLRKHEPDTFKRIAVALQPADYVIYRMTGRTVTDRSNACATGVYNLRTGDWDGDILSAVNVSDTILPELGDSGTIAGHVAPEVASELGLAVGTPLVLGAWDQVCAVVGAGSVSDQDALLSTGTAWVLLEPIKRLHMDPLARIWAVQHARARQYVLMIAMSNGGAVVEWYRHVFAGVKDEEDADQVTAGGLCGLPAGVEDVPPGSNGILVLPHLIGAMGIHMEPEYSGCILGLRHGTGKTEIFRAILEAVAYEVRWSLEAMDKAGFPVHRLRMIGGATRSPIWPQIVADVTGLEVLISHETECAVLGAARLAQEGIGMDVLPQSRATHVKRRCEPDPQSAAVYAEYYEAYRLTHKALKESMDQLTRLSTS